MNITVVVLHYENIKDTKECLDSLKKYLNDTKNNINVVVVDNGSIKEKTAAIEEDYVNDKIYFIESCRNLGFAKGNNIGFHYAKYELHSDIIILANNDLIFKQVDFMNQIAKEMIENHIDVAGPRIISLVDHKNQNPVPYAHPDLVSVNKRIFKLHVLKIMCYFGVDKFFQTIFSRKYSADVKSDNYQLHGACLIMANNYVKNYDGLYPKTFMYMEEDILKYITKRDNLIMKYFDGAEVFHKEGSSTEKIYGEGRKKRLFYYKWNIDGCKKLRQLMKSGRDK
ncbi:Predicted glycosyltransferases [Coprococcus catus GD/7]|uniref:Predicted glycosyltransferases n=1 Tax=Coprococcus catus GD/7 TaxID=717962 RepID=D4J4S1_9FIRM|nr:glycosyltransferase [Coprococcus catus]CBK79342.1 Predicted glycosyltransferases [Coprococcus catus GD/7]